MTRLATLDLETLRRAPLTELEALYREAPIWDLPSGVFCGQMLALLPHLSPPLRVFDRIAFDRVPYGVDFDRRLWYFFHPRLAAGRFQARLGASRWRPGAVTNALRYQPSHLPRFVRGRLYDEIKPLTQDLCLGIGGLDGPAGVGDHFFFALTRQA